MLPGFNHNIRYKDRVFHVQTEDNGLKQPRLITQVFIDGHVLALEKSHYDDIIAKAPDEKVRDDQIRTKMQDQHKQLLKNLVKGAYDERIAAYLGGPDDPSELPHHQDIPVAVLREAEAMPSAPAHPDSLTQELEAIIIDAPEEISPESLLDPEFLEEIGAAVEAETRRDALDRPPTPISSLIDDLALSRGQRPAKTIPKDDDFLSVLDAELKPQLPFDPTSEEADTQRPAPAASLDEDQVTIRPPPTARPRGGGGRDQDVALSRKPQRRELPPPGDTLVDFGLPAALRATLERPSPKNKKPGAPARPPPTTSKRPSDALFDQELANVAASLRPVTNTPARNDQTMLEVDSAALERQIAEQRARLKRQEQQKEAAARAAAPTSTPKPRGKSKTKDDDKDIVVVERSLDEVILSYLADDQDS